MLRKNDRAIRTSCRVQMIRPERIRPNPLQPRRHFDPAALQELADSIRQHGILQPLTVRKTPDGPELVAGERRLRAARLAGLREVPCMFVAVDEEQSGMLALVENLQRRDLDYLEEAEGLAELMSRFGLSQEQAAEKVGKSQSAVANKLRLLKHPPEVLEALRRTGLTERHARALLRLPEGERLDAVARIARCGWTVAQTEQYIEARLQEPQPERKPPKILFRDVRVFLNSLDRSLELIRSAGIDCACGREDTDGEIILTIRLPKQKGA